VCGRFVDVILLVIACALYVCVCVYVCVCAQTVSISGFNFGPLGTAVIASYSTRKTIVSVATPSAAIVSSHVNGE
jgi:hypothetical protein